MNIHCHIGIGSNLGDRLQHVRSALSLLEQIPNTTLAAISPWYETEAITLGESQPPYINGCATLSTTLSAGMVLQYLHDIESHMGRPLPRGKWEARSIDLDLLSFGTTVCDGPDLALPHPELAKRRFVLLPLNDIAPDWIHPITGQSIITLIEHAPPLVCRQLPKEIR